MKEEIFTEKIVKGKRTYFFDINESEEGEMYLKISESKQTENGFEHYRIMVFQEDVKGFADSFHKTLARFKEFTTSETKEKKYSVEKIRQTYRQAYLPWSKEDDDKLELLFCEGKKIKELSLIFGRNNGAIDSRIKKLELKEKYNK
jgi:hypothetical protein